MKLKTLRSLLLPCLLAAGVTQMNNAAIIISEIDSDTPGTDDAEFVELYSTTGTTTSLDGLSVVFFNGSNDESYFVLDLDTLSTGSDGFFVLGNSGVSGVDSVFSSNGLQNGADAVALYTGDFSLNTGPTTTNLLQAIVYDTNDGDDSGLLTGLGETIQYNEDEGGDKDNQSLVYNMTSGTWANGTPTPGAIPEPSATFLGAIGSLLLLRRRR